MPHWVYVYESVIWSHSEVPLWEDGGAPAVWADGAGGVLLSSTHFQGTANNRRHGHVGIAVSPDSSTAFYPTNPRPEVRGQAPVGKELEFCIFVWSSAQPTSRSAAR